MGYAFSIAGIAVTGATILLLDARIAATERQVVELRNKQVELTTRPPLAAAEAAIAHAHADPPHHDPPAIGAMAAPASPRTAAAIVRAPSRAEIAAQWEEDYEAALLDLENRHAHESTDAKWGPEADRTLHASLAAALPPSAKVDAIDCRSSVCRVDLVYSEAEAARDLLSVVSDPKAVGWEGWSQIVPGDSSSSGTELALYLGRIGTTSADKR